MATTHQFAVLPACMLALGLSACGGGGGSAAPGDAGPTLSVLNSSVLEGDSGTQQLAFTVTSDSAATSDIVVSYASSDGSASAGSDYTAVSGSVTIPSGATQGSLLVPVSGDTAVEDDETFTLTFTGPDGQTYNATATIQNDDLSAISIADASLAEGDSGSSHLHLTVSLDQPAFSDVTVNYSSADVTAVAGVDYSAVSGSLTIPAGQRSAVISVPLLGDTQVEFNEDFSVTLSAPSANATLADAEALATIVDDEVPHLPRLSISDASLTEGDSGEQLMVFSVNLNRAATGPVTVSYRTLAGTASSSDDFVSVGNGLLTFQTGELAQFASVSIAGDRRVEANETLIVELLGITGEAAIADASATGTILDNDLPQVSVADASAAENAGPVQFVISLDQPAVGDVTLQASTANGSATAGSDYSPLSGQTISIPAGQQSATVSVALLDDSDLDPDETFSLSLSGLSSNAAFADASATGMILDDELPPPAQISISDAALSEGDAGTQTLSFSVTLDKPAEGAIAVDYRTANGSATSADDFDAVSGTLNFAVGEQQKSVSVTLRGDTTVEADEQFSVELSNATGRGAIADGSATGSILNDDLPALSLNNISLDEADGQAVFTVSLDQPGTADISVTLNTEDDSATAASGDYTAISGQTLNIPAGQTSATVSVAVADDELAEATERFRLRLSNPQGATLGTVVGSALIADNDRPRLSVADVQISEGDSGSSNLDFVISLNQLLTEAVSVDYATANDSASSVTDYSPRNGRVTIPAGQQSVTISVPVSGDTTVEGDETLSFTLTAPSSNAMLAPDASVATGTIGNDDQLQVSTGSQLRSEPDIGSVPMTFTVSLGNSTDIPLAVDWRLLAGSASTPDDYQDASGTLSFGPGDSSAEINVNIAGDNLIEGDETFTLALSSSDANVAIATPSVTGTIVDDDKPELSIGHAQVTEGSGGESTLLRFDISLSEAAVGAVTVDYATADGSAEAGADYTALSGTLTLAEGETSAQLEVAVRDDELAELAETLSLTLSNPSSNAHLAFAADVGTGTILNDDAPDLSISDASAYEGSASSDNTLDLIVATSVPAIGTTTVDFATASEAGDNAVAGVDYTARSGSVTIAEGESEARVQIDISGDDGLDLLARKTFTVSLSNASLNAVLTGPSARGTIIDDDGSKVASTGVSQCGDEISNDRNCPQSSHPVQDGNVGRAGFSYTKLDATGADLADNAASWACVRDDVTGLIWEVKLNDGGERDKDNRYGWYDAALENIDPTFEPWSGTAGIDALTVENTAEFVAAVNASGLCGFSDWRLPHIDELYSLADLGTTSGPAIDGDVFSNTERDKYWTATSYRTVSHQRKSAWVVDFDSGHLSPINKSSALAIRLVRGGN